MEEFHSIAVKIHHMRGSLNHDIDIELRSSNTIMHQKVDEIRNIPHGKTTFLKRGAIKVSMEPEQQDLDYDIMVTL